MEVQRSNKDHHLKRVRFNASVITVRDSQKDKKFEKTIDLIVVYISEFDIFKRGRVIYHCFLQKEIDNAKFPKLTNRVHYLKHEEGGVQKMCEVMEQYSKKAVKKATKQANITAIKNMLEFKIPKESILKKYTESEYNTAIAELESESR